jgi:hypothetical protein
VTAVLAAALLVSSCTTGTGSSDSTGSAEPTASANSLSPIGAGLEGPAGLIVGTVLFVRSDRNR